MKTISLTILFLLITLSFSACNSSKKVVDETTIEAPPSDCIKATKRNLGKANLNLQNLQSTELNDSTKSVVEKEAIRFTTTLVGLETSIADCKAIELEYDFGDIDLQLKKLTEQHKSLLMLLKDQ